MSIWKKVALDCRIGVVATARLLSWRFRVTNKSALCGLSAGLCALADQLPFLQQMARDHGPRLKR